MSWQHHGCAISWAEHDELGFGFTKGVAPGSPLYLGLQEAAKAFGRRRLHSAAGNRSGSSYRKIRSNLVSSFVSPRSLQLDDCESDCVCSPMEGCGENCLNRQCKIECQARTCPAGARCTNQRFQTRDYKKLRVFKTIARGGSAEG
eukprot:SAG31_NODE_12103_length_968_cov_1.126582_2_plen_145_part_01